MICGQERGHGVFTMIASRWAETSSAYLCKRCPPAVRLSAHRALPDLERERRRWQPPGGRLLQKMEVGGGLHGDVSLAACAGWGSPPARAAASATLRRRAGAAPSSNPVPPQWRMRGCGFTDQLALHVTAPTSAACSKSQACLRCAALPQAGDSAVLNGYSGHTASMTAGRMERATLRQTSLIHR